MFAWHNKQFDCASNRALYSQEILERSFFCCSLERDKLVWYFCNVPFEKCAAEIEICVPCVSVNVCVSVFLLSLSPCIEFKCKRSADVKCQERKRLCNWAKICVESWASQNCFSSRKNFCAVFVNFSPFHSRVFSPKVGEKATKFYFGKNHFAMQIFSEFFRKYFKVDRVQLEFKYSLPPNIKRGEFIRFLIRKRIIEFSKILIKTAGCFWGETLRKCQRFFRN